MRASLSLGFTLLSKPREWFAAWSEGEPWWLWRDRVSTVSVEQLSDPLSPTSRRNGDQSERTQFSPSWMSHGIPQPLLGCQQKAHAVGFNKPNLLTVHIHLCACSCVWRPGLDIEFLPPSCSTLALETASVTEPEAHWNSARLVSPVRSMDCLVFSSQYWDYRCAL